MAPLSEIERAQLRHDVQMNASEVFAEETEAVIVQPVLEEVSRYRLSARSSSRIHLRWFPVRVSPRALSVRASSSVKSIQMSASGFRK
jgi:hypothetical protein